MVGTLLLILVPAAPVPLPKARPTVVGTWDMEWGHGGHLYYVTLLADGTWRSFTIRGDGDLLYWVGTWKLEGDRLTIRERLDEPDTCEFEWSVDLAPGRLSSRPGSPYHMVLRRP